jgi:hypothetical protein
MAKRQVFKVLVLKPVGINAGIPTIQMVVEPGIPPYFPSRPLAERWIDTEGKEDTAYTILEHWQDEKFLE